MLAIVVNGGWKWNEKEETEKKDGGGGTENKIKQKPIWKKDFYLKLNEHVKLIREKKIYKTLDQFYYSRKKRKLENYNYFV